MNVFDEMGKYWAEIADQNPTDMQIQFIKNILKANGLILDLACGTGRHAVPLSKEGHDMVGLDISPNLLRIAKNHSSSVKLVMADMRRLPFRSGNKFVINVRLRQNLHTKPRMP
jgi:ubiquinone/menaquinone biosynthesis C-methylase UbiE